MENFFEKTLNEIRENQNIRSNLSELRKRLKEEDCREALCREISLDEPRWFGFLEAEDAKTRKNAALLFGDLRYERAADPLWEAYIRENTMFVKSSYLSALCPMDIREKLPQLHERMRRLTEEAHEAEAAKHIQEELREIHRILIAYEGIAEHEFVFGGEERELLLTGNLLHRDFILRSLSVKNGRVHPLGVIVQTDNLLDLMSTRMFRELLFPVHTASLVEPDPAAAAAALWESDLYPLIRGLHKGEDCFYFRIECRNRLTLEERSAFTRKVSFELEKLSGGKLVNAPNDYEIEIRLIGNREGRMFPALKCRKLEDLRFSYRKNAIAASIHPSTAALIVGLSEPYLKKNAQIMDPFCGVGTMLIERNKRVPAKEMYATDIFGDAIGYGRENAGIAGANIHFIHRDFFDFKHEYLFDEIITDMPVRGKKTKDEMDRLYEMFFKKALEITKREAVIVMYCNETAFVKKQLRLHRELRLQKEIAMQQKGDYSLFIIGILR